MLKKLQLFVLIIVTVRIGTLYSVLPASEIFGSKRVNNLHV